VGVAYVRMARIGIACIRMARMGMALHTLTTNMGAPVLLEIIDSIEMGRRGWILQERFLSPAILHYGNTQMHWECREGRNITGQVRSGNAQIRRFIFRFYLTANEGPFNLG
jgi:hypothetical protein